MRRQLLTNVNVDGVDLPSTELSDSTVIRPLSAYPVDRASLSKLLKQYPLSKNELAAILREGQLTKEEIREVLTEFSQ